MTTVVLRSEVKPREKRSALTPSTAKKLQDSGIKVLVEKSPERIFDDKEFEDAGLELVEEGYWRNAPKDYIILGLKEFPESDTFPLEHEHIQFAHCYKNQAGWQDVLKRFTTGGGKLYDLEFLEDDSGRRVAAFGFHAGFAGAAVGLQSWALQQDGKILGKLDFYPNENELISDIKSQLNGKQPKVLIIGALGRCGSGAVSLLQKAGLPDENIIKWDMAETSQKEGPYQEIIDADIFINCIYLSKKIPPFVNQQSVDQESRKLQTIVDVSADNSNPNNPIPICNVTTTFDEPMHYVPVNAGPSLAVCSVDHLPSYVSREASEAFSEALLPYLKQLPERTSANTWVGAEKLFSQKCGEL